MRFYLLSDNRDTQVGMRLAGVEGRIVHGEQELRSAFELAARNSETAVLLITEKLAKLCPDCIAAHREAGGIPLIAILPDRHGNMHN